MTDIIAELGINHLGDTAKAKRMIERLALSDLTSIKFQFRQTTGFFTDEMEMGSTLVKQELDGVNLCCEDTVEICEFARAKNLKVGVSFFRKKDMLNFCTKFLPDYIKIPSAEALNFSLINAAQDIVKEVIISTGGLDFKKLKVLRKNVKLRSTDCIMHCISNYPSSISLIKPEFVTELRKMFKCKVGYSSHDERWEACLPFLPLNIELIERHYCESNDDVGLDISTSSTLEDLVRLNSFCKCRDWGLKYKLKDKEINQGELLNIKDLGSGYYFDRDYRIGDMVAINNLIIRSPCRGLKVGSISNFEIKRHAKKFDPVTPSYLKKSSHQSSLNLDFLDIKRISLPIRTHDAVKINKAFGLGHYEWHLSFSECKNIRKTYKNEFQSKLKGKKFSIHLPDYISSSALIDPFSNEKEQKEYSHNLITECAKFACDLQNQTGSQVPIVGSFSVLNGSKDNFYDNIGNLICRYNNEFDVQIMPQFLPKVAWYFGGNYKLNVFCSFSDIKYYQKIPFGICLDTAHCIMAANFESQDGNDWIKKMLAVSRHLHLSDAKGIDGEGVKFGTGDLDLINCRVLDENSIKVIEQWEGHLDNFLGFKEALRYIEKC